MTKLLSVVVAIICLIGFSPEMHGQELNCINCPPGTPWQTATITWPVGENCSVTIQYKHNICNGAVNMQVTGVVFTGTCIGVDKSAAIEKALVQVVRENEINFPTGAPGTNANTIWRIARPACWQQVGPNLTPCTTECCVTAITVVRKAACATYEFVGENNQLPWRACPISPSSQSEGEGGTPTGCHFVCTETLTGLNSKSGK